MKTKFRFNLSLRLIAALSASLLFLLLAFAMHYQSGLEQMELHTGVLEMMAAAIPLLSLLLAAVLSLPRKRQVIARQKRRPAQH